MHCGASKDRRSAVSALGRLRDPRAIQPLTEAAIRDDLGLVAEAAVFVLFDFDPKGVDAAISLLRHENPRVWESAVRVLCYKKHPKLIDPMLEALDDRVLQACAANTLSWIVDERGIDLAVRSFAKKDARHKVRHAALSKIASSEHPRKVDLLIEGLNDRHDRVQTLAAHSLGRLRSTEAVEPLMTALKTASYNGVRAEAAEALAEIGDRRAFDALVGALKDPNLLVRREAAAALGRLGDTRAVTSLLPLLADEEFDARISSIFALAKFEREMKRRQ